MKLIKVKIKGIAPLLQHRFPVEEHGVNAKKGKKKVYIPKEEAEKSLYRDKEKNIVHPTEHIFGAMIKAGVAHTFEGRKTYKEIIKSGLVIEPEFVPLLDNKGKNFKTWSEIDARPVVIQRARVMCWRPKFDDWQLEFTIKVLDDENISIPTVKDILETAGQRQGIGDYRPRFGRFQVVSFKEL